MITDKLIDFDEMRFKVRDLVLLSLSTYKSHLDLSLDYDVGTEQDPVKILVNHNGVVAKYLFRKTIESYAVDNYETCFKVSYEVVRTYCRAFFLVYPKYEQLLTKEEVLKSLFHWTMLVLEDCWVEELKNSLLKCFSKAFDQEEPNYHTCHTPYVLRGNIGRYAWQKGLRKKGLQGKIWINTVLHGIKKGVPTVGDSFIERALIKHSKQLTADEESSEEFLQLVEDVSKKIFKGVTVKEPTVLHKISQNATVTSNRSKGGTMNDIGAMRNFVSDELIYMWWTPREGVQSLYCNKFYTLLDRLRPEYLYARTPWGVEGVKEPLKFRVITKGSAEYNSVWSDVQGQLLSSIQRYNCFRLTAGEVVEKDGKANCLLFEDCFNKPDWTFVSGDYAGATDTIKREVMISATAGIRDPGLRSLLISNLSNGTISYKGICERMGISVIPDVEQVRGQLMGSIFSFPILCLINLCTYIWACRKTDNAISSWKKSKNGYLPSIKNLPVLINGDDILFISPCQEFYNNWLQGCGEAGFKLSVGKNYCSQSFFIVNSRLHWPERIDPADLPIHAIPYVNMGLINGRKKGEDTTVDPKSMREKMSCLPNYFKDLLKDFRGNRLLKNMTYSIKSLWDRIRSHVWDIRTDVRRSGWSRTILGLTPFWGGAKGSSTDLYEHRAISRSKHTDRKFRTNIERSLFFIERSEVDTSILSDLRNKKVGYKSLKQFLKEDQEKKEQLIIDEQWSRLVTPFIGDIKITDSLNSRPYEQKISDPIFCDKCTHNEGKLGECQVTFENRHYRHKAEMSKLKKVLKQETITKRNSDRISLLDVNYCVDDFITTEVDLFESFRYTRKYNYGFSQGMSEYELIEG